MHHKWKIRLNNKIIRGEEVEKKKEIGREWAGGRDREKNIKF